MCLLDLAGLTRLVLGASRSLRLANVICDIQCHARVLARKECAMISTSLALRRLDLCSLPARIIF